MTTVTKQPRARRPLTAEQRQLVERSVPLVGWAIAKYGQFPGIPCPRDAYSEALMVLVFAAGAFDPARGFRFSTYFAACYRRWCRRTHAASLKAASDRGTGLFSIDQIRSCVHDEESYPLHDYRPDHTVAVENRDAVEKLLGLLPAPEREVVEMRFGLRGGVPMDMQEIADEVGVSRPMIYQRLESAKARMVAHVGGLKIKRGRHRHARH